MGASYLSRKDGFQVLTDLFGLEATYKKREGNVLKWLLQAEAFLEVKSGPLLDTTEKAGAYVFSQYGLDQNWSFGFRLDGYSHLNMKFASNNQKRKDFDYAFVPTLTYKASEFSTVRLAYSHEVDTTQGVSNIEDRQFQLQFIYILGAHAAHHF